MEYWSIGALGKMDCSILFPHSPGFFHHSNAPFPLYFPLPASPLTTHTGFSAARRWP